MKLHRTQVIRSVRSAAIQLGHAVALCCFGLVVILCCAATAVQGEDLYGPASSSTDTVASESSHDPNLAALERAIKVQQEKMAMGTNSAAAALPVSTGLGANGLMAFAAIFLAVTLGFSLFVRELNSNRKERAALAKKQAEEALRKKIIAEQPTLVALFNDLRHGLEPATEAKGAESSKTADNGSKAENHIERLHEFYETAPERISVFRNQLAKLSRMPERVSRVELIREFFIHVEAFRRESDMPETRPVWLMNCGLAGLLQQLSMAANELNPSILRTIASALKLLEDLSVADIDPELASRTRVQILAVDDNAVCRMALSRALKKAFHEPDLAVEGKSALVLAEKNIYDAIFLDIEMPGMDGFELCSRIHATGINQTTPIVFVTSHGDFESRAKSAEVGAQSLIAKPYLSFEITLKALTLTLRGRLENAGARPRTGQLIASKAA